MTHVATAPLETGWSDATPVDDNVVRRFVRNQGDLGATIALASGGRAGEGPGVALADAGGDLLWLNQATMLRPLAGVDDPALDTIDDFWREHPGRGNVLLSVWPTPDLAPRGWELVGHPMLVVRSPGAHPALVRDGVSVEVVRDHHALIEAERVAVEGYPMPELVGRPPGSALAPGVLETEVTYRIGRFLGAPAGVAASFVAHDIVNLCLAATLPVARRKGVWSELVWARVDDAPDLPAVAYTSDDSRPGFVRMGFLPITRCTLWGR